MGITLIILLQVIYPCLLSAHEKEELGFFKKKKKNTTIDSHFSWSVL